MKQAFCADKFFLPCGVEGPGYLVIEDGKFAGYSKDEPSGAEVISCKGGWIAPGLVDTHIHGMLNHDVMDNDPEGLKAVSQGLPACGVTSFFPTTLTAPEVQTNAVVKMIGDNYKKMPGARIEGIFLEGPFFTGKYRGNQNIKYLSAPSIKMAENWQKLAGGLIKKIAVAPEYEGAKEFIRWCAANNIKTALGHSSATYAQAKEAVENGASIFVHAYNGMSPLHHREPGMAGAAMSLKNVFAELICDGQHVHPVAAKILMDAKGRGHTVLITDCMMAGGMPDGDYKLGEIPVTLKDGAVKNSEGRLAGSALTLIKAVKNTVDWDIASPEQAVMMASLIPAVSCGVDNICGKISPGRRADFIVLTPSLELKATFIDGKLRHGAV
jgi:N-acetylglucosamine-6-phosphate deacetylase